MPTRAKPSSPANLTRLKAALRRRLAPRRYQHSLRVAVCAQKIADLCGASGSDAYLAGLLHDCEKTANAAQLLSKARQYRLRLTPVYRNNPLLLHGPLGALTARQEFGLAKPRILNAIKNHTLGRAGMSKLEKIIYVADYIEPGRRRPDARLIRRQLFKDGDLNRAVLSKAQSVLKYLKTIKAVNCSRARRKKS